MSQTSFSIRLTRTFDAELLRRDLLACDAYRWVAPFEGESKYQEEGWELLPLQSRGGRIDDGSAGTVSLEPFAGTELLEHTPYIREVLADLRCSLTSVRISALRPGGVIKEHEDPGCTVLGGEQIRMHIPIVTSDDVDLFIGGERCRWGPGELWYGDFNAPHSVVNRGTETRVHLLVMARVDAHVLRLFPPEFVAAHQLDLGVASPALAPEALRRFECDFATSLAAASPEVARDLSRAAASLPGRVSALLANVVEAPLSVRVAGERLALVFDGQPVFYLEPSGEDRFRVLDLPFDGVAFSAADVSFLPVGATPARASVVVRLRGQALEFVVAIAR